MPLLNMSAPTNRHAQLLERVASHWSFAGATAAMGAFAGLLGSVYTAEIKNAFPFGWWPDDPVVWVAVSFWASLVGFGIMFGLNIRGQARAAERQIDRLRDETRVLEGLVRTLPPENFLERFQSVLEETYTSVLQSRQQGPDQQRLVDEIQTNVGAIAFLARMFDGDHEGAIYSANIMLYKPMTELKDDELARLEGAIQFLGEEHLVLRESLSGLLVLNPSLAMSANAKTRYQDANMPQLVLPVPSPDRRCYGAYSGVLPGAPEAFLNPDGLSAYMNTDSLAEYCRDQKLFHPRVADELQTYFNTPPGNAVKSFFSISIPNPETFRLGSSCEPMGVLNIHSNKTDMLGEREITMFLPLVRPFVLWIATLVEQLKVIQAASLPSPSPANPSQEANK